MSRGTGNIATHGYSGRTLSQKLGIRAGTRLFHINAPRSYADLLADVWSELDAMPATIRDADIVHVFCETRLDLENCVAETIPEVLSNASLWVSWRKGKKGFVPPINREDVRTAILPSGLVDVKVCAVDEDWSAMKFLHRRLPGKG